MKNEILKRLNKIEQTGLSIEKPFLTIISYDSTCESWIAIENYGSNQITHYRKKVKLDNPEDYKIDTNVIIERNLTE